jgi:hypothetical protein
MADRGRFSFTEGNDPVICPKEIQDANKQKINRDIPASFQDAYA